MDNRASQDPSCPTASTCGIWNVWYRTSPDGLLWTPELRIDGPAFAALQPHAYQSAAGFSFPYGDYGWLALDDLGNTYAAWGEGPSWAGPGSVWFTRN
jgi:hypothetical protein